MGSSVNRNFTLLEVCFVEKQIYSDLRGITTILFVVRKRLGPMYILFLHNTF